MKRLLCALSLALVVGCGSVASDATPPKGSALRSVVVTMAKATVDADVACSAVVHAIEATGDEGAAEKLAHECTMVARDALDVLAVADESLDTYDAAKASLVVCAIGHAAAGLSELVLLVNRNGGHVPPLVHDALELAGAFSGGACPVPVDAGAQG